MRRADAVRQHEVHAVSGCQWRGIGVSKHLAVGIGNPRSSAKVNSEVGAVVGDVVVVQITGGAERGGDVIWAAGHGFTSRTAVSGADVICRDEVIAAAGG